MAPHADAIVGQVQQEFQALIAYVTGPDTAGSTADEVERTLFRRLLGLGLALLRLVFVTRAADRPPAPRGAHGARWVAHGRRPTTYVSVFGKPTFARHAVWAPRRCSTCGRCGSPAPGTPIGSSTVSSNIELVLRRA